MFLFILFWILWFLWLLGLVTPLGSGLLSRVHGVIPLVLIGILGLRVLGNPMTK